MTQHRIFALFPRADVDRAFAAFERAFEEDGLPLGIIEIDEDADIHELSLYAEAEDAETVKAHANAILSGIGLPAVLESEAVPDIDWVSKSLEGLKPVRAGRFLVHGSHDRDKRRAGDLAIEIEAGLAFGTGHHGTTSGCLEMIARVVRAEHPRNSLDLGTGSGVLAIAMAKLARIPVLATDIDPIAVAVTRDNARLNHVDAFIDARTAPGFHNPAFAAYAPFDLIVANILAGPLMKLAPAVARHIARGGSIILSGILERQREAVLAAYVGQRFRHVATLHREGWVTLHLKR